MNTYRASTHRSRAGMTLIEVMVAVFLLTLLTMSVVGGLTFNARVARLNNNRMLAKNMAQGLVDQMRAEEFSLVGPIGFGTGAYQNHVPGGPTWGTFWIDESMQIPCQIYFNFKGYGVVGAGSTTSMVTDATVANAGTSRDPDRVVPADGGEVEDGVIGWRTDEWAGALLCIYGPPNPLAGNARTARVSARIAGNTVNQLTLAAPLPFTPDATMAYMIDNGKTVAVTTRWQFQGTWYRQSMKGLIANYRDSTNLGF